MTVCAVIFLFLTLMSIPANSPAMFMFFLFLTIVCAISAIVKRARYRREMPMFEEQPVNPIDPPREPISGTFTCSACGAPTTIDREIDPPTSCCYCGAELPDIKEMILSRNQRRQKRIDEDLERQKRDQRERLNIHLAQKNEYLAMKRHARAEQIKATGQATLALGVAVAIIFLAVIVLPLWLLFH